MTVDILYMLLGVALFTMGMFALLSYKHLLRRILAVNIMGSGVFMVLIAAANRHPTNEPDPIPHAMVLTGIVVAVSATTLALALASRLRQATGRPILPDEVERE